MWESMPLADSHMPLAKTFPSLRGTWWGFNANPCNKVTKQSPDGMSCLRDCFGRSSLAMTATVYGIASAVPYNDVAEN